MTGNHRDNKPQLASPSKKALILELARELHKPKLTAAEIEQIRRQLIARLGPQGKTESDYILTVLKEAGMRVAFSTRTDTEDLYEEEFEDLLHFSTLDEAEMCLIRLDELLRKFLTEGERAPAERVREVARLGRRRAEMIARNRKVEPKKRQSKEEVAHWFAVWLETPDAFFDWLEVRKQSPEFQEQFPGRRPGTRALNAINSEEYVYLLDVEALDLGPEVRAVGLELVEADENREPVRGEDATHIWSRILPAVAGSEPWGLDFFSHLDRVRGYLLHHEIDFREAGQHFISVPAPKPKHLEALLARFQGETFGVRAGTLATAGDPALEGELARRGADAYDTTFPNYYFCAICAFEDGSLVLLSDNLRSSDVIRKVRPALEDLDVKTQLPS